MEIVIYKKDTHAHCKTCGSLVFVFSRDVYQHERTSASQLYQDRGQAPFYPGQDMICKKCKTNIQLDSMIYVKAISLTEDRFREAFNKIAFPLTHEDLMMYEALRRELFGS